MIDASGGLLADGGGRKPQSRGEAVLREKPLASPASVLAGFRPRVQTAGVFISQLDLRASGDGEARPALSNAISLLVCVFKGNSEGAVFISFLFGSSLEILPKCKRLLKDFLLLIVISLSGCDRKA